MASKAIRLSGEPNEWEQLTASAAITPGDVVEINSSQWRRHASAGKNAIRAIALPRDEMGNDIDIDYAASQYVKVDFGRSGDRFNLWIASGEDLSYGTFVESDGSGGVRALSTDAATDDTQRVSVIGMSLAVSGAVTVRTRHPVLLW